jgi:hypothetical protein
LSFRFPCCLSVFSSFCVLSVSEETPALFACEINQSSLAPGAGCSALLPGQ